MAAQPPGRRKAEVSAQVFNKQNVFAKGPTKLEDAMMYATTPHMFSASPCALSRA